MAWFQSTYTIRFNNRHRLCGHVFAGRYKSQIVEGSGTGYLKTACDYAHLNPVRARMVKPDERLLAYPWSSFGAYAATPEHRPTWVRVDRLLGEHGIQQDTPEGRQRFEEPMERWRWEETDPEALKSLQRGWCLGSLAFRKEMLERMQGSLGGYHAGELHREAANARAERIIAEELARHGWGEPDLANRRKNDPVKLEIAGRLRRETILSIQDIAKRVHLGTSKAANSNLHRHLRAAESGPQSGIELSGTYGKRTTLWVDPVTVRVVHRCHE